MGRKHIVWSNYSDLTRPHPKWWFSKGNPLISGKSRLVKYYNLARYSNLIKLPNALQLELFWLVVGGSDTDRGIWRNMEKVCDVCFKF